MRIITAIAAGIAAPVAAGFLYVGYDTIKSRQNTRQFRDKVKELQANGSPYGSSISTPGKRIVTCAQNDAQGKPVVDQYSLLSNLVKKKGLDLDDYQPQRVQILEGFDCTMWY